MCERGAWSHLIIIQPVVGQVKVRQCLIALKRLQACYGDETFNTAPVTVSSPCTPFLAQVRLHQLQQSSAAIVNVPAMLAGTC
jgi:hypothetical protein